MASGSYMDVIGEYIVAKQRLECSGIVTCLYCGHAHSLQHGESLAPCAVCSGSLYWYTSSRDRVLDGIASRYWLSVCPYNLTD